MAERVFGHAIVVPNSALGDAVALELCLPGAAQQHPAQRRPLFNLPSVASDGSVKPGKQSRGFGRLAASIQRPREREILAALTMTGVAMRCREERPATGNSPSWRVPAQISAASPRLLLGNQSACSTKFERIFGAWGRTPAQRLESTAQEHDENSPCRGSG